MDFEAILDNLPFVLVILAILLIPYFIGRRRGAPMRTQEIARRLLAEVRLNQALAGSFHLWEKPKKFETTIWQISEKKLDFLSQSLQSDLADTFLLINDFNQKLTAAKKNKSLGFRDEIDVAELKEPLARSREGLENWLFARSGLKEPPPKYPNVIDGLFGG